MKSKTPQPEPVSEPVIHTIKGHKMASTHDWEAQRRYYMACQSIQRWFAITNTPLPESQNHSKVIAATPHQLHAATAAMRAIHLN